MKIIKESIEKCLKESIKEDYLPRLKYWNDDFSNKVYTVMNEIEREMDYYEELKSDNNIDDNEATVYSALKKAYESLDELIHI